MKVRGTCCQVPQSTVKEVNTTHTLYSKSSDLCEKRTEIEISFPWKYSVFTEYIIYQFFQRIKTNSICLSHTVYRLTSEYTAQDIRMAFFCLFGAQNCHLSPSKRAGRTFCSTSLEFHWRKQAIKVGTTWGVSKWPKCPFWETYYYKTK